MPRVHCVNMGCDFEGELPVGDPCPECGFHGFLHPVADDTRQAAVSGSSPDADEDPQADDQVSARGTV